MTAPESVLRLVERFARNRDEYRAGGYNEAQVRQEFIDPLFAALGWDIDNSRGAPEAYKEVVHEDAIRIGGAHKAPDYSFRAEGSRKFFVEAKKPSVNLRDDITPAFQLRRYAWSAKLPLSVLTDFEEFVVYDTRVRPAKSDTAATARLRHITYDTYPERWDEITEHFSRAAVYDGAFDRYAEELPTKRGTATVDTAFLREIEEWRTLLARNIALRNPGLSQRELNFAVQMTIDRIIFLRMAEDRGIETYGRLNALRNGGDVYARLRDLYRQADERYNSGLFHFQPERERAEQPDRLTPGLTIDDKTLKDIFRDLYYPDSPYEFAVLPVDVLGQVYEQFLGKVIRLTPGRRVQIEEKPEVRKAGGVYYTPTYIVDYIVEHTVGKLLEGKTPRQVARLKIVDPACGSGSFLIGAYQCLLDWHRDYYVTDGPEKHPKELYESIGGEWRLTTAERKRILLNNLYGVDIDPQAVEVTKLSLLLKQLEGATDQSVARQLQFAYKERVLPDLSNNIKCGNSLIGPDFYDNQQMTLLADEEHYRINVFDWRASFPDVFSGRDPGFDAVIGNPPYIRIQALKEWAPIEVEFYKRAYRAASKGNYDIYVVFVERGLSLLNKQGKLGYILPHKFFNARSGEPLRTLISEGKHLSQIVHFGHQQVFQGATTYTCLLFLDMVAKEFFRFIKVDDLREWRSAGSSTEGLISADAANQQDWTFSTGGRARLHERLSKIPRSLGQISSRIGQGVRTSANEVFVLDALSCSNGFLVAHSKQLNANVRLEASSVLDFLQGREVKPYRVLPSSKVVLMPYQIDGRRAKLLSTKNMNELYPEAFAYLLMNKKHLEERERGRFKGAEWYAYGRNQNIDLMLLPKIIVPDIADKASFALDRDGSYAFTSGYGIVLRDDVNESVLYVLGLLNSSVLDFYLKYVSTPIRGGYVRYFTQFVQQLPISTIDFDNQTDVGRHDRMVELVERMLALHERLAEARTSHERTMLQNQVAATDRQIDRLVYELYELTDDEIRIVEEGTR